MTLEVPGVHLELVPSPHPPCVGPLIPKPLTIGVGYELGRLETIYPLDSIIT
jgi:hypothetical protein